MKKKLIIIVLLFSSLFSIFATGMPVIDVAAIAQAVTEAITQVQQWNQQLKQWQSEYERVRKAAEKITSGDFMSVVSGLASLTSQMSGWAGSLSWADGEDWLKSASDGSYSLLSMMNNSQMLATNMESIIKKIETNANKSAKDGWEAGSNAFSVATGVGDFFVSSLSGAASIGLDGLNLANDVLNMLRVSPDDIAEMYEKQVSSALQNAKFNSYEDLVKSTDNLKSQLSSAEAKLLDISASESPDQYAQQQAQIASLTSQINEQESLAEKINKVNAKISTIKENQAEYDKNLKEENDKEIAIQQANNHANAKASIMDSENIDNAVVSSLESVGTIKAKDGNSYDIYSNGSSYYTSVYGVTCKVRTENSSNWEASLKDLVDKTIDRMMETED